LDERKGKERKGRRRKERTAWREIHTHPLLPSTTFFNFFREFPSPMPNIQQLLLKIMNLIPTIVPIILIVGILIYVMAIQGVDPTTSIFQYISNIILPRMDKPILIG
jgi:hypothetical protein